jgi:hypothetical protein
MRPLSVGEILDASFSAFRRNFGRLCLAVLVIVVPSAIVQTLVLSSVGGFDNDSNGNIFSSDFDSSSSSDSLSGGETAAVVVVLLLLIINQLLAPAACLRIIGADIMGIKVSAKESVGFALRRLPRILWALFLFGLLMVVLFFVGAFIIGALSVGGVGLAVLGAIAMVPGFIWIYVLCSLFIPIVLYEDTRGVKSLSRSRFLVTGAWWRTFGVLFIMFVIASIVQQLFSLAIVGGVLLDTNNTLLAAVLSTISTAVGATLALPLLAAAMSYLYFDLRVRKEGFDLMLMAQQIDVGAAPAPGVEGLPSREAPPSSGGGFLPPQAPGA